MGGVVRSLPGDEVIRRLPSFRSINWEIKPGDYCAITKDCFTRFYFYLLRHYFHLPV